MTEPKFWTENTKPDRPGIWLFRRSNGGVESAYVTQDTLRHQMRGTWAFLMDLPTIVDPPKYREVRKGDEGEEIKVAGYDAKTYFIGFTRNGSVVHELCGLPYLSPADKCRILDEPVKKAREPREWWINLYPEHAACHETEESATKMQRDRNFLGRVHVREVIDEAAE